MRQQLMATALVMCTGIAGASAQSYPSRPLTMVVPYAAGGPTDTIARIMSERMRGPLGQTVIVENTTGAAGTIGVGRVARAAPDGYTISIGHWGTHVVNGAIYSLPVRRVQGLRTGLVDRHQSADHRCPQGRARERPEGAGGLAEGEFREGHAGHGRPRQRFPCQRRLLPERDRRRASSSCRIAAPVRDAGPGGRPDRHDDRSGRQFVAASACRHRQGLRGDGQDAPRRRARYSDGGRGGRARSAHFDLACALGAQGHAEGHHRQTQRRRAREPRRSGGAQAIDRTRSGDSPRSISRRRRRSPPTTRPRSRNGGPSSRRRTSRRNERARRKQARNNRGEHRDETVFVHRDGCRIGGRVVRVGANLSGASDHAGRAVPAGRLDRRGGAHHGREDAAHPRPAGHHRERRRRGRLRSRSAASHARRPTATRSTSASGTPTSAASSTI